jgi:two-component system, OmpR family, alkaline phosphatase synthesis response regulator PhoP
MILSPINKNMPEKNKSILIVEDEQALQEALKLRLKKEGIETLIAGTGEDALDILKKHKPSLVSLDILLPKMNGLEVLKNIREDKDTKDLPVVIVSVSGGQEKIKRAFGLNVIDYLVKSEYTIDDIIKKLKNILSNLK